MGDSVCSIIPDPADLLALEPEDLAGVILGHRNSLPEHTRSNQLHPEAFCGQHGLEGYATEHRKRISQALMEDWAWPEREGLVARRPGDLAGNWFFVTGRESALRDHIDLQACRKESLLPRDLLHPAIIQRSVDSTNSVFQWFPWRCLDIPIAFAHH